MVLQFGYFATLLFPSRILQLDWSGSLPPLEANIREDTSDTGGSVLSVPIGDGGDNTALLSNPSPPEICGLIRSRFSR